jgi:hypothetical protein
MGMLGCTLDLAPGFDSVVFWRPLGEQGIAIRHAFFVFVQHYF